MEDREKIVRLLEFISKSPTAYQAVDNFSLSALEHGFIELDEKKRFSLERGKSYFITRGGTSMILFRVPKEDFSSYSIISAHTDSPTFKIKRNAEYSAAQLYTTLNVEGYGGMIISSWLDRPLSVAGRLFYRENEKIKELKVNIERDLLVIPGLAIHQNREVNNGYAYHIQKDAMPLFSTSHSSFSALLASECGIKEEDILDFDLYLYNRTPYSIWGSKGEFISSARLDDMECAYIAFTSLMETESFRALPVVALFDNEEVGSASCRGALSDFLANTLKRISSSLGLDGEEELMREASSLVVSADNAHAVHPGHAEKSDITNKCVLNGGVVIKHAANQKYTTDAYTASIIRSIMLDNKIKCQDFFNNSDVQGGSTLGNLSIQKVSIPTVDVGLAQLAMHSSYESAGSDDVIYLERFFKAFLKR